MKLLITLAMAVLPVYDMTTTTANTPLTYLALGDSYTVGKPYRLKGRSPYQLADGLNKAKHTVEQPEIIATTGWTTDELITAINNTKTKHRQYDIVTLLIGVNNQYRGYPEAVYRSEFIKLLHTAIAFAGGNKARVFVLSIPDWGVTPYADGRNRKQIAQEIDRFNAIGKQETQQAEVAFIDITPASKQAGTEPDLTAGDGLHPSAKQYGLWVNELLPIIEKQLK